MATPQYAVDASQPTTILNAASATGPGLAYANAQIQGNASSGGGSWQTVVTGSPSGISVNLEGSNDGVNWFALDNSVATGGEVRDVNTATTFLRANLATLTGGTSPTVSVIFCAGS